MSRDRRGSGRARPRRGDGEESIWSRPEPGARRPRHTRAEIAAAAIAIADADGFDAVSMRRVARELGAGTMTLYHYVRTKDDLLALMDDELMGRVLVPAGELSADWREALRQIARRTRDVWTAHPWAIEALRGTRFGPNGLRHVEQSLQAVSGVAADRLTRLRIISSVDDYVLGHVIRRFVGPAGRGGGVGAGIRAMGEFIEAHLGSGDFPELEAWTADEGVQAAMERALSEATSDARFEWGLERLLDGLSRYAEDHRD